MFSAYFSPPDSSIIFVFLQAQEREARGVFLEAEERAAKIDPSMLEAFANQQMVDITAVQPGTKANGFTGVSF